MITDIEREDSVIAGTKEGGLEAAKTNKQKYGADFYTRIGSRGGKAGHTGGFASNHDHAVACGRVGGILSRRDGKLSDEARTRIKSELKLGIKPQVDRSDYLKEQEADNRQKLSSLAQKYGREVKRV